MGKKAWNEYQRGAINSLDEGRGWTRYIDPPIPLYIVSCSPDNERSLHVSINQTMSYLDMPEGSLVTGQNVTKADGNMLVKLRKAQYAKPECATTMVHFISRKDFEGEDIAPKGLVKVSVHLMFQSSYVTFLHISPSCCGIDHSIQEDITTIAA